jgi:hypothetical protein
VIASAWGLGAAGAEESPYDPRTAEEAAPQLYDEEASSSAVIAGGGGAGPPIGDKAGNVAAWLRLATIPILETGAHAGSRDRAAARRRGGTAWRVSHPVVVQGTHRGGALRHDSSP